MGYWYYQTASVIEDTWKITIQDLKAWGLLKPGERSNTITFSRGWPGCEPMEKITIRITVNIDNDWTPSIQFDYSLNGKPLSYSYLIEKVSCHYGNVRYYFICRETGKRVTALYFVGGYFASRHYHKMTYQCSRDHRSVNNLLHRYWNLERKAEYQEKHGHPRKAKELFIKAYRYQTADLQQVTAWMIDKYGL